MKIALRLLPLLITLQKTTAFIQSGIHHHRHHHLHLFSRTHPQRPSFHLHASSDDDDDDIDLSEKDWRAFRAKLVRDEPHDDDNKGGGDKESSSSSTTSQKKQQPSNSSDVMSPADFQDDLDGIGAALWTSSSQTQSSSSSSSSSSSLAGETWAHMAGYTIETGAVILGGVDQDFGFGLRQQYFHKVAILILEHEEGRFTKGIILNRPTDMFLETSADQKWRVWFGGDVQGLDSGMPDVICLHSLEGEEQIEGSVRVMKDIRSCSFETARGLVEEGVAQPSDFWVFCGYAGWGPGQLMGELERKSWYAVATDEQTLLKELARQALTVDPRNAGLDTWELLMKMVGKEDRVLQTKNNFDDLMLKEWARNRLCKEYYQFLSGGATGTNPAASKLINLIAPPASPTPPKPTTDPITPKLTPGTILRAGKALRSPFLLSRQEFHKSLVLILSDDKDLTVGVILNRPAAKGLDLEIVDKITSRRKIKTIPLRYGGEYAVKGHSPLLWLHCSDELKKEGVGSPLTPGSELSDKGRPWKCTSDEATTAIGKGQASYHDFMVVSGVSAWPKSLGALTPQGVAVAMATGALPAGGGGMAAAVQSGHFEVVKRADLKKVWGVLQNQMLLTNENLEENLGIGNEAWTMAGMDGSEGNGSVGDSGGDEDDSLVFKSDMKVDKLSDNALRSWVATFLLGAPGMF